MEDDALGEGIDFSGQKSLGSCPKCGGSVFEHGANFVCEKSLSHGADSRASCDFSLSKNVLKQPISDEQVVKLLDSGKTDFLDGFTSIRTNQLFTGRLVWDVDEGKVGFEFPDPQRSDAAKPVKVAKGAKVEEAAKRKSSNAVAVVTKKFISNHQTASAKFLDDLFKLDNSLDDFEEAGKNSSEIGTALQAADHSVLNKFLEREDCPDWLGVWIARHGRKEQQFAYLFRPNVDEEMSIADQIGSRSPEIRRLFWNSRAAIFVETLMAHDDEIYFAWARDLGFDREIVTPNLKSRDEDKYVPPLRAQIDDWIEKVLDPVTDALWKEYVPNEGACTVLQGEMARCIGRLEHEYWKNGMLNMGDGLYDNMVDKVKKTVLSRNSFSPLVKKVLGIDASVVKSANYAQIVNSTLFQASDVEISLSRMKNVVAAWCLKNQEPIRLTSAVNLQSERF